MVMAAEALAAVPRGVARLLPAEAVAACSFEPLALILSRLLRRPVGATTVRDRAVGLGMLRLPPAGAVPRLSAEKASRLLLAGYGLPALADVVTPARAREHLAAERHVFILQVGAAPAAVEGHAIEEEPAAWPFDAGEGADRLMVVAARGWDDLPTTGARFFGGTREKDGSYHWDAADCDTDASGRILRVW
jgi:hypothetical protein